MSKRIWSESRLIWDKAGSELWNVIRKLPFTSGGDGAGVSQFLDWQEEQEYIHQPTILLEDFSPNLTANKKRLLEIAGISRNYAQTKEVREDVSIFITEVKITTK
jgi:hypothetical protein